MTKEKVIVLRTFDECSPELQRKILDRYRYMETDEYWFTEMMYSIVNVALSSKFGFLTDDGDLCWDMSCSQGSGASFSCSRFDWDRLLGGLDIRHRKFWASYLDWAGLRIVTRDYHYTHKYTKRWSTGDSVPDLDDYPHLSREFDRIMEYLEDLRLKACGVMYDTLRDEYDYHESDEYLSEQLTNIDTFFNEEGEIER